MTLTEDLWEIKWNIFQDFIKSYSPSTWFSPLLDVYACLTGSWVVKYMVPTRMDRGRHFFHQKPYSPQVLESLPTTVDPGNKDKTCQPVPMAADTGITSGQLGKDAEKCIWKTMMVRFIFLPDSELPRTWQWPEKFSVNHLCTLLKPQMGEPTEEANGFIAVGSNSKGATPYSKTRLSIHCNQQNKPRPCAHCIIELWAGHSS